jgi:hypothetical protein
MGCCICSLCWLLAGYSAVFWSKALFNVAIVTPEILAVCSLLQLVTLTSALFIFFLSLRSEVLVSQAHELTVALTPTFSLAFGPDGPAAFQDHIAWLKDNLSPDKFPGQPTVAFTVSNPLYGIAVSVEVAKQFVDYFRMWVDHYAVGKPSAEPPVWKFAVWKAEDSSRVFGTDISQCWTDGGLALLEEFARQLYRAYELSSKGIIDFHLYEIDRSDARVFTVHTSQKWGGLFVTFSQLATSAVTSGKWRMAAFGIQDQKAFSHLANFNQQLYYNDVLGPRAVRLDNRVEELGDLKSCINWLRRHFTLPDQRPGQTGQPASSSNGELTKDAANS